ncbi:heterokaryon incompatibility protein-domain-containing protein, partial [Alternaria rosae]|uniref:heterokaryon incompatibility protein-domain-containing protein n=1 Tax=Alternaria rosae TaxID=1187941 RepID=UPI001E8E478C
MRLLDTRTLELKAFVDSIPPYAILSHCWTDDEVVFSDLADLEQARKKKGFSKIEKTCELAIGDGFDYAWIDTCCIDKSSSAELSEAINSMFAWYRDSEQCYAYLADVELQGAFAQGEAARHQNIFSLSKWFTRAWTLQELLAPSNLQSGRDEGMKFYSRDWQLLGSKASIGRRISQITGIPMEYLEGQSLETASISMRMSWAADRQATRSEDIAYSLLGIFDVNMPLLYGE